MAHILFGVGVPPGSNECRQIIARLEGRGYPTEDISGIELAQVGVGWVGWVGWGGGWGWGAGVCVEGALACSPSPLAFI